MSVESLTRIAFGNGGVSLGTTNFLARGGQQEMAIDFAKAIDKSFTDVVPFNKEGTVTMFRGDDTPSIQPHINLFQSGCGTGKTFAYLIPVIFNINLRKTGKPSLIATNTINLRAQIIDKDAAFANKVAKIVWDQCNPNIPFQEVTFGEIVSPFYFLSLKSIQDALKMNPSDSDIAALHQFVENEYLNGRIPEVSEWFETGGKIPDTVPYGGRLNSRELNMKKAPACQHGDIIFDLIKDMKENIRQDKRQDVLVATHAMFYRNSLQFGKKIGEDFDVVVIDESDRYSDVAEMNINQHIELDHVVDTIEDGCLPANVKKEIKNHVATVKQNVSAILVGMGSSKSFDYWSSADIEKFIKDHLKAGIVDPLKEIHRVFKKHKLYDQENTLREPINDLETICSFKLDPTKFQNQIVGNSSPELIFVKSGKTFDVKFVLSPHTAILLNRFWRSGSLFRANAVSFFSGTLSGYALEYGKFNTFKTNVGIKNDSDRVMLEKEYNNTKHARIANLFLSCSSDGVPHPTDNIETTGRQEYAKYVSAVLSQIAANGRTLVLFPSDELKMLTANEFIGTNGNSRVIINKKGQKYAALLNDLINTPDAIWFGHNWLGANFIDTQNNTLFKNIVIAQIPIAPTPDTSHSPQDQTTFFKKNLENAARLVIQGIGRGTRNEVDRPNVFILDPRAGLPRKHFPKYRRSWDTKEIGVKDDKNDVYDNKKYFLSGIPDHLFGPDPITGDTTVLHKIEFDGAFANFKTL